MGEATFLMTKLLHKKLLHRTRLKYFLLFSFLLPKLSFIHITDTHIESQTSIETVKNINIAINNLSPKPDFVVHTGDFVNDPKDLSMAKSLFDELKYKFFPVIGNHDNFGGKNYSYFKDCYPDLNYTWQIGNFLFVAIDNSYGDYTESDRQKLLETANWLENILKKNSDKLTFVFMHYPLVPIPFFTSSEGRAIPYGPVIVLRDKSIKNVVDKYRKNIIAVICGHAHVGVIQVEDGVIHAIGPAIDVSPRFRQFLVYDDKLVIKDYEVHPKTIKKVLEKKYKFKEIKEK